ncbi:hypothetical protein J7E38_01640 [Bacillus sp. ISL-35]|uniref:hypothetical protein n=1 Tax=Bacillus sp. ISL-35 TaxID=2819122 RepID=UPI001BE5BC41|nr:hypothetical protein [Bacillus sp. ISL-35]MBT2677682.1 hypothetical protein [Bacillus sp. ISL-35]MBT2704604.1 hypothetical protein [Chryseobacterium sp. ISL-80]
MHWKVFRLVIGLLSGYLVINWMTTVIPLHSEEFVSESILNPFGFLAGSMMLAIGMFSMGGLIGDGILAVKNIVKGDEGSVADITLAIICFGCFFMLFPLGWWQTAIFFVFCLLYGMMSFSSTENKENGQT